MTAFRLLLLFASLLVLELGAVPAHAAFVPWAQFDGLATGPIDGQEGWYASSDLSLVTVDPANPGNQVLSIVTESNLLRRALAIPDGERRMVFLRLRVESQLNLSFGLSESVVPTQSDQFDVELSIDNESNQLRVNDGGIYRTLKYLASGGWYNFWIYIDGASDSIQLWVNDLPLRHAIDWDLQDADGLDRFAFRYSRARNLQTFYIKTGGGSGVGGPLYLDDIFVEDVEGVLNLTNPLTDVVAVEEPRPPARPQLEWQGPNPFANRTVLGIVLPAPADAHLTVHDLAGRCVATLHRGPLAAGRHELGWDGRGDAGQPLAAGLYVLRFDAAGSGESRRVVLLR
jgi:hypothetical protein